MALDFLGISLETILMEARLPNEKLERTKRVVCEWLHKKLATKREILSLVGLLQHATKVVQPGQSFLSRMYMSRTPFLHTAEQGVSVRPRMLAHVLGSLELDRFYPNGRLPSAPEPLHSD